MNVIVMKAPVTFDERALVASMHPLRPGADVLLRPPRRGRAAQSCVDLATLCAMKQFEEGFDRNRVGPASRTRDRWIDQYQLFNR